MKYERVTVFGGASTHPGDIPYVDAERLGRLLGQAGITVINGGYIGTMEAVSKGASEAGGHVIGVTCSEIENWRSVGVNPYIQEECRCQTLSERLETMINICDAAIALPGGVGTLTEILYLWNHLIVQAVPLKPLIIVGEAWLAVLDVFFTHLDGYTPETQRRLVQSVPDVDTAAQIIITSQ